MLLQGDLDPSSPADKNLDLRRWRLGGDARYPLDHPTTTQRACSGASGVRQPGKLEWHYCSAAILVVIPPFSPSRGEGQDRGTRDLPVDLEG